LAQIWPEGDPDLRGISNAFWAKNHHRPSAWAKFGPKKRALLLYVGAVTKLQKLVWADFFCEKPGFGIPPMPLFCCLLACC
jgi:hypothetical protein